MNTKYTCLHNPALCFVINPAANRQDPRVFLPPLFQSGIVSSKLVPPECLTKPQRWLTFSENGGRMGNQLFLFAAALAIANKRGFKLCRRQVHANGLLSFLDWAHVPRCPLEYFNHLNIDRGSLCGGIGGADEDFAEFQADNIELHGYGQSHEFFKGAEIAVKDGIRFKAQASCKKSFVDFGISGVSVALHVRRGDFYANITATPFFIQAIHVLAAKASLPPSKMCFVVATDDPQWVDTVLIPKIRAISSCIHTLYQQKLSADADICILRCGTA
jgi:hypothetical protein